MDKIRINKDIEAISPTAAAYERLYETIQVLRAPGGCPWDREQSPLSMRKDLVEEVFEAVDAITNGDAAHSKEELGDVMLNATIIAYMYEQSCDFTIADALNELVDKLIRRHPHVFTESEGNVCVTEKAENPAEVLVQWDRIKEHVEGRKSDHSVLDEVPDGFPPLLKSYKMQKKAAKKGFDWNSIVPVLDKIKEEFNEVQEAAGEIPETDPHVLPYSSKSTQEMDRAQLHLEEEIGDLIFAVVNYARHMGIDPTVALTRTNSKFYRRFAFVEQQMKVSDIPMDMDHTGDMDRFWNKAKEQEQ